MSAQLGVAYARVFDGLAGRRAKVVSPSRALTLLVVEDDALIGRLLVDVLANLGHVAMIVTTEDAAVAAAARYRPDLMIVDVTLGDGNGIAAVDQILSKGPMPHIFVSGDPSKVWAARPDAIVLQKPFRQQDLARAIQRLMGLDP